MAGCAGHSLTRSGKMGCETHTKQFINYREVIKRTRGYIGFRRTFDIDVPFNELKYRTIRPLTIYEDFSMAVLRV